MLTLLGRRLIGALLALLLASLIVFVVLEVLPGDAAQLMLGINADPAALAALRAELGLDRPAPARFLLWLAELLQGELGRSHTNARPVAALIGERLGVTVPLALFAFLLSTNLAVPLGFLAALRRDRAGDVVVMALSQLGLAVPEFWLGLLLILLFAVSLGWLPAGGFPGWQGGVGGALAALLLPAVTLGLNQAAILARVARRAAITALAADHVRTARAKGLSEPRVILGHVLRNTLATLLALMGLQLAFLLAGVIVVENLFYLPGLGRLLLQAVTQRDVVVVRDLVLLFVFVAIALNFLVDVLVAVIDPRPRATA
ncbi:MAG: ABC transporter permease [Alphaproteobacteria bacterium]|nr:ABC transporter permease [Alphaproteobacteria bacterium]